MLKPIKKYFAKLSHYPRLRILLIVAAVIVAFIIVMNLLRPSNEVTMNSNVQAAAPSGNTSTPVSTSQASQYDQLHQVAQKQALQQASADGSSIFQNAFPGASGSSPTPAATDTSSATSSTTTATTPSSATTSQPTSFASANAALQQNQNPQDAALSQQVQALQQQLASAQQNQAAAQSQEFSATEQAMRSGIQNLSSTWKTPTFQTVGGSSSSGSGGIGGGSTLQAPVDIKAGSILFGVIDTALDSDSPNTPVLARIVEGKYQGARLIGGFTATKDALVIQFNSMSLPNGNASFPINAYAVDARTANNSVVTSVDNHYLLRYGMLFASSFLQGFGNAYNSYTYNCPPGTQNCSVVNTNSSGVTTTNNDVTTRTAFYQGLGQMGQNAAQAAAQEFNTPPTIKVAQGTGIGVLFMSDTRIPLNSY